MLLYEYIYIYSWGFSFSPTEEGRGTKGFVVVLMQDTGSVTHAEGVGVQKVSTNLNGAKRGCRFNRRAH